jgi:hypothetical protein
MPVDKYDDESRAAQDPSRPESRKAGRLGDQTRVIYG